jgi:hypothetical protein
MINSMMIVIPMEGCDVFDDGYYMHLFSSLFFSIHHAATSELFNTLQGIKLLQEHI